MKSITDLVAARRQGRTFSMVTCYDTWTARILRQSDVDCILVGEFVVIKYLD